MHDETPIERDGHNSVRVVPLLIFIAAMAISNCLLGYYDSRSLLGPSLPDFQDVATFVSSGLAVAQGVLVLILGGLAFRHWLVGICVAIMVAGLWTSSFFCWHFAIYLNYDHVTGRFNDLFSFICFLPIVTILGCLPSLITRVAMCSARPKNNSILELFAIMSFLASVLALSILSGRLQKDWDANLVFYLVVGTLGSALTTTPASLLYFTATDERKGMERVILFAAVLTGLFGCPAIPLARSTSVALIVFLWFLLLFAVVLIGLRCIGRSGLGIRNRAPVGDAPSNVVIENNQRHFIWVIIGAPAAAFIANLIAMIVGAK